MKKLNILLLVIILGISTQFDFTKDKEISRNLSSSIKETIKEEKKDKPVSEETKIEEVKESEQPEIAMTSQTNNSYQEVRNVVENNGTVGRLLIPSVDLNVGVNYASYYDDENYNAQSIVDKEDSAAYFQFGEKTTIADHNYQGFYKIVNLELGAEAYLKRQNSTEVYRLINKFIGQNISEDLIDSAGSSVQDMDGNLIIYTCYGSGNSIMVTMWNRTA